MPSRKPIPDGYHSLQPYLIFPDCRAAIAFYTAAFGASERLLANNDQGRVMHAEIQIGDAVLMMADEAPAMQAFGPQHFGGSPVSLLIYSADCDALYRQALAQGAKSLRAPADQSYGDRMAAVEDPFGYRWWLATHLAD